ncbi:hypothetical protein ABZ342_44525 [Amycolatopsis sp. NPDC005961]|uniref:hypothetical protein n=1 Tax=Amycolatopsis sp. NPDC005961 TaxID=3156720 RepID=UPI003408CEA3
MAQKVDITLNENNDENVNCALTTNNPTAGTTLDLTGMTLEAFLKPSKSSLDTDGAVWKGTSSPAAGVTVTNAVGGLVTVSFPASAIDTTKTWWRIDVISSGGKRKTALYGTVTVNDL